MVRTTSGASWASTLPPPNAAMARPAVRIPSARAPVRARCCTMTSSSGRCTPRLERVQPIRGDSRRPAGGMSTGLTSPRWVHPQPAGDASSRDRRPQVISVVTPTNGRRPGRAAGPTSPPPPRRRVAALLEAPCMLRDGRSPRDLGVVKYRPGGCHEHAGVLEPSARGRCDRWRRFRGRRRRPRSRQVRMRPPSRPAGGSSSPPGPRRSGRPSRPPSRVRCRRPPPRPSPRPSRRASSTPRPATPRSGTPRRRRPRGA